MASPHALAALHLLTLAARDLPHDFVGLGIVFYHSLDGLPILQLESGDPETYPLPVDREQAICALLAETATRTSPWHDGFHLIEAESMRLTHLCQYIAPPIPKSQADTPHASGARHMTAALASRVPGIAVVGLLTHDRVVSIYESGVLKVNKVVS